MKVYLIESNINGVITYKIGKTSRNVNIRLLELSTGNAGKMRVVCMYESDNANLIETTLHSQYSHRRLSGEWFKDEILPDDFLRDCRQIDNNLKKLKNANNPFI